MKRIRISHCTISVLFALCCGSATFAAAEPVTTHPAPDYNNASDWCVRTESPDKPYDVFFVHPTTYGTTNDGLNASLQNTAINLATDGAVADQASVYVRCCNVYAPRYRQLSMAVLSMKPEAREPYLSVADADVLAAFEFYLAHYNNGRPYILASHSQGSYLLQRLLEKHRALVKDDQLIAAYLIGWSFTQDELAQKNLPLATTPQQTGGLITWNTIGKGGESPTLFGEAVCVNPLSWTDSADNEPAELNRCAIIGLEDGTTTNIPHFTSARINERGGLEIPTPFIEPQLNMSMGPAIYHRYDYAFFYSNLVENVQVRCNAWPQK